jgi:hypothetical protein
MSRLARGTSTYEDPDAERRAERRVVASWLPYLVIALGLSLSAYHLSMLRPGFVLSADGGLKSMVVEQFARGDWSVRLDLQAPAWVEALWARGMFPILFPFVTTTDVDRVVAFPFWFQLLNAPFYAIFGYFGLYVVPTLSLWILWFRFERISSRLGADVPARTISTAVLIFATPRPSGRSSDPLFRS